MVQGHFSMLGLGDIVMPGLLLCFVMRYDAYKKAQHAKMAEAGIPLPSNWTRISYFHCSLFGYFLGLLTATISSEVRPRSSVHHITPSIRRCQLIVCLPGFQSCPARPPLPGPIHAAATVRDGVSEGDYV